MQVTVTTLQNMINTLESAYNERQAILDRLRNTKVKKCFGLITTTQFEEVYDNGYLGLTYIRKPYDVIFKNLALQYGYIDKEELEVLNKTVGLSSNSIKGLKDMLRLYKFSEEVGTTNSLYVSESLVLQYIELTE
ncbi:hypothetical protein EKK58_12385 [Candidatus Dependentiae bacterium]|nr:MAG: hypothetical protein EKK58_12385 [Candidatus Dependentiae bacterium]